MNQHSRARRMNGWRQATLVCVAAGMLGGLSSCDRHDPVADALKHAEIKLGTVNLAGSMPLPSDGRRKAVYDEVIRTLGNLGDSAGPGQQAAANLLLARAHAGLAEIQAGTAASGEGAFLAEVIRARSVLDKWQSQNATADALDVYDPAKDLAELDKQIAEKSREAEDMLGKKTAQEQVVAGLRAQAEGIQGQAKSIREQEAGLRARAQGTAAVSRAALIEQSAERRRAADALDKQASELLAKASVEAPKIDELGKQAERLKTQQQLLRQAQVDIRARAEAGKGFASKAREEAKGAGTEIAQLLTTLGTTRDTLSAPSDTAVSGYQKAVQAAKKASTASKEGKAAASVAAGSFQQSMADALATKARGQLNFASLLQAAADTRPALTGAAAWKEKAKAASEQASATVKEAEEAYKAALSTFEGAGAGDKAKGVTEALKRLIEEKSKASLDPKAIEEEVRAALAARASLAPEDAMKDVQYKNEQTKTALEALAPTTAKLAELKAAAKEKFGKSLEELVKGSEKASVKSNPVLAGLAGGGGMGLPTVGGGDLSAATIQVLSPTRAKVSMGPGGTQEMVKVDGVWKMNLELPEMAIQQMKMMKPMLDGMAGVVDGVVGKTKAGEYASADDMLEDLGKKIMEAAMAGMKPGGEKPAGDKKGGG